MGAQARREVNPRMVAVGQGDGLCCLAGLSISDQKEGRRQAGGGMAGGTEGRLVVIDLARTVALIGMAVFHFTFDLEMFGLVAPGTTTTGGWAIFARVVAGSFLFLAGVSLVLAHGGGIRWPSFLRRMAKLAGAALLVTAGTYAAFPHAFVFFGILHSIALASLLGLAVIRLPAVGLLLLAALVVAVDRSVAQEALNPRWWAWIGLGTMQPPSVDLVPVFPWFASVLMGMAVAKLAGAGGLWSRLAAGQPSGIARWLAWPGRHSLVIYLLHQPVLIGGLWLFLWLRA